MQIDQSSAISAPRAIHGMNNVVFKYRYRRCREREFATYIPRPIHTSPIEISLHSQSTSFQVSWASNPGVGVDNLVTKTARKARRPRNLKGQTAGIKIVPNNFSYINWPCSWLGLKTTLLPKLCT